MKDWNLQLIAPNGQVFEMGTMGYASATIEHAYIFPSIEKYLRNSSLSQREFILAGLQQTLLNGGFYQFHGYRLAWGDADPEKNHAAYPDGSSIHWTLYLLINGQRQILLQGSLPENWWTLEEWERQQLVEDQVNSFGAA